MLAGAARGSELAKLAHSVKGFKPGNVSTVNRKAGTAVRITYQASSPADPVTGKTDYRLRRCEDSNTCPKTFEANSANEFWAKAASIMQTDSRGRDLDLASVASSRYYLFASFPHGAGNGPGICAQPHSTTAFAQYPPRHA